MKMKIRTIIALGVLCLSCLIMPLGAQNLDPLQWPSLKGYWKFQDTNNLTKATVGNDLILIGAHEVVPGAAYGDTASRIAVGSYYKAFHGMLPNGGGDSVNRYTLMFDFKVLNLERWHTFHQTDTSNTNDGECFIRPISTATPGAIGVGYTGYSADTVTPGVWYRLMISVNLGNFYRYYLNGALIHEGDSTEIFIDGRFALTEAILFFADNNQEDDTIDIASIAIFDTCLTAAQIAQIGTIDPCIATPPAIDLGVDTVLCWDQSISLSAGAGFQSYLWSTGETTPTIVLDTASIGVGQAQVWVEVVDMNNCPGNDTILVSFVNCTGLSEFHPYEGIRIFPNPSTGIFHIDLHAGNAIMQVLNLHSQLVQPEIHLSKGTLTLDLTYLPAGVYFVRIIKDSQIDTRKVVIR